MKRNIALIFTLLIFGYGIAQKNKFAEVMNSKKLGMMIKKVNDKDKEDYYQQFYWLRKAEELKSYPHLAGIKPKVFYTFVKEINPQIPTKELDAKEKELRETALHALNIFFANKDWTNPLLKYNLETYVDPSAKRYYTHIDPEKVEVLLPKQVFTFTSHDLKTKAQKRYYLWLKDDKFRFIDIFPKKDLKENKEFEADMKQYMTNFQISKMVPTNVVNGDKRDKKDIDFYYITPYQEGNENIVYKTEDFEKYYLVRYKKNGAAWVDIDRKKVIF